MTKVHPNALEERQPGEEAAAVPGEAAALTVWQKSLLFHGEGFTVFDGKGNLVFRVDNYASAGRGEIVLMDAAGKPLLTIRRKKLSLGDHWLIYDGEEAANPRFAVKKKHVSLIGSRSLAHVTPCSASSGNSACPACQVEGSYSRRSCAVYDERRRQLAQIKRKQSDSGVVYGDDVFRLIVEPGCDPAFAMAIVILLEQMSGSRRSLLRG